MILLFTHPWRVCLYRVAKEEEHNKMTPNSLAIVFAPCVLRSPDVENPLLGIRDVSKTTLWVVLHSYNSPLSCTSFFFCFFELTCRKSQSHRFLLSSGQIHELYELYVVCRCVEILISEQLRRYNEKMQNIQELEYAEAVAVNQLKLRRQNTVSSHLLLIVVVIIMTRNCEITNMTLGVWTLKPVLTV